jgi:hypothetical protein
MVIPLIFQTTEDKCWRQLTDEERSAADQLGYTKESWDAE